MTTAEKTTEPRILIAGASLPADLSVHRIDLARSAAQLLQVSEAQLRAASFLDDRLVQPDMLVQWVPLQSLVDAGFKAGPGATLHCIFHAGHAGSTLMSRVLDGVDGVLGLREPQVLRQLAETLDTLHSPESFVSPDSFRALVEAQANLWARGFKGTQCVVLKATSHAVRLGPVLLGVRPTTRSISLSLKPEVHITGLLAGPTPFQDLRSQAPERFRRLRAMGIDVQTPLYRLSPGQLAALSWLTEAASQSVLSQVAGGRNLPVDFDDFLRDVPSGLHRVLGHFGLPDDDATI